MVDRSMADGESDGVRSLKIEEQRPFNSHMKSWSRFRTVQSEQSSRMWASEESG
jgi:hypothetical protein